MKKTLLTISVAVMLVLSVPLSAFAASVDVSLNPDYFTMEYCQILVGEERRNAQTATFDFDSTGKLGRLYIRNSGGMSSQWRAKFNPTSNFPSFPVKPFMQLSVGIYYTHTTTVNYTPQSITGALYMTNSDGTIFEFPVIDQIDLVNPDDDRNPFLGYYIRVGGVADISKGFDLNKCSFEFVLNGLSTPNTLDITFRDFNFVMLEHISDDTVKVVESVDKGFSELKDAVQQGTQDIIDNNNANTDKITQNQDDNTDKITGSIEDSTDKIINDDLGYETPDEVTDNKNVIQTLTSQVNVLNDNLETVKKDIDDGAENFISSAEDFGDFINQFFDMLPTALVALIFGLIIFLVLRKVVGR